MNPTPIIPMRLPLTALAVAFTLTIRLLIVAVALPAHAGQPAFPGAEGFGRYASGGRGGDVYHVTNLQDSGAGSLRDGIQSAHGPRTIVFDRSGTIALESPLVINRSHLTIAGQTAPGDGITLRNHVLKIAADHVIVRFIRSRLGDLGGKSQDAISVTAGKNIILDHCSASWGIDECLSAQSDVVDLLTVQWCMVTEGLDRSIHEKGAHGKGTIIGSLRQSFHHNLWVHQMDRSPKVSWRHFCQADVRNNVMYNWGGASCHDASHSHVNWVANYYKPGPATANGVRSCIFEIWNQPAEGVKEDALLYIVGNHIEGLPEISADNWAGGVHFRDGTGLKNRASQPFPFPKISYETNAIDAFPRVLAAAGASLSRDAVDQRNAEEVRTGKPRFGRNGIIDSQKDVGGWPELRSLPAPQDSDRDGMPDAWEKKHGLDANHPADRNSDRDHDGYTNLEEYLNSIITVHSSPQQENAPGTR
jgi:pectate lyase